jgi:hypothetical protein
MGYHAQAVGVGRKEMGVIYIPTCGASLDSSSIFLVVFQVDFSHIQ